MRQTVATDRNDLFAWLGNGLQVVHTYSHFYLESVPCDVNASSVLAGSQTIQMDDHTISNTHSLFEWTAIGIPISRTRFQKKHIRIADVLCSAWADVCDPNLFAQTRRWVSSPLSSPLYSQYFLLTVQSRKKISRIHIFAGGKNRLYFIDVILLSMNNWKCDYLWFINRLNCLPFECHLVWCLMCVFAILQNKSDKQVIYSVFFSLCLWTWYRSVCRRKAYRFQLQLLRVWRIHFLSLFNSWSVCCGKFHPHFIRTNKISQSFHGNLFVSLFLLLTECLCKSRPYDMSGHFGSISRHQLSHCGVFAPNAAVPNRSKNFWLCILIAIDWNPGDTKCCRHRHWCRHGRCPQCKETSTKWCEP